MVACICSMNTVCFIPCHKSATQANKKKIIAAFMKHSIKVCILTLDILVLDPMIAINIHLQISENKTLLIKMIISFVIIMTSQPGSFLETSLGCLTQTRWSFHQITSLIVHDLPKIMHIHTYICTYTCICKCYMYLLTSFNPQVQAVTNLSK